MRRHGTGIAVVAAGLAVLLAAAGCTGGDGEGDLPDAAGLLASAADEMAGVETVAMRLETDANLADLPIREVDGVITRAGNAEGTARLEQFGQLVEARFVVVDDTFHYQVIGAWQELPREDVTDFYDPSAVLDPDRGVPNLLRTATDARVERRDGDRYEVSAVFDPAGLAAVLPGASEGTRGTVWIGVDRPLLHRAEFPVGAGDSEAGTLRVELSDFDAPVEIRAP